LGGGILVFVSIQLEQLFSGNLNTGGQNEMETTFLLPVIKLAALT
jgi:hypothetical protein